PCQLPRRGADARRAAHLRELKREDGRAAGGLRQDSLDGLHAAEFDHRTPGGQSGAGKGSGFDVGKVIRSPDQCLRWKDVVLGEDAVDGAAERALHLGRARFAADPRLAEAADDAIARRKLPDIWTHRLHDASTVRNWYQRKLLTRSVHALDREKVAIVQRRGFDAHQHPAWAGLRGRLVYQTESLDTSGPCNSKHFILAFPS